MKEQLLAWIAQDEALLVDFLSRFIQVPSPNPPGDTRAATAYLQQFLDAEGVPSRIVAPQVTMPNLVASFAGAAAGRHLVLNGHIDVFPVSDEARWTYPPWSGMVADGKVYGRGAIDSKAGTTAILFAYRYLYRIRDQLKGRLTLTCVSDEETFGAWGARYLVENDPAVRGDCLMSAEPSSPWCVRFGEKGLLWLELTVQTRGAHGAYAHMSESATKVAARLIGELESLTQLPVDMPAVVREALQTARAEVERAHGAGAAEVIPAITVNIGRVEGGVKVNMTPSQARIELDVRLPIGVTREVVMDALGRILERYPQATVREMHHNAANWCDPNHPMVRIVQENVRALKGFTPKPVVSLGGTDTRLWRYIGVPAFVYGTSPSNMGTVDEYASIDEFLHTVRVHTLAAYDYLTGAGN
ncbi:MAG: M20/M25/M40 family metallo-hydrolase [Chloroflexi bacterium]|nr:M20/M25/M40 family metallo-hydrolase [Chloroflexota bacterium]